MPVFSKPLTTKKEQASACWYSTREKVRGYEARDVKAVADVLKIPL